jgi:hypothetical protein
MIYIDITDCVGPTSRPKEPFQMSKGLIVSELLVNLNRLEDIIPGR